MRSRTAESSAPLFDITLNRARVDEFHRAVAARFACAARRGQVFRRTYQIGDGIVQMEFAGDVLLAPVTRALEHLSVTTERTADLTIGLWEIDSSGVGLPPPPWDRDAYIQRGEIRGFNDADYVTTFNPDGRILCTYDIQAKHAYCAAFQQTLIPAYERAAPLRAILARYLQTRDIEYLHAAAVGLPEGGVLITGKGGAGKSTSSLACLEGGLFFAGDDYCGASFKGAPTAYSLYSSAKGVADSIQRLPFLEPFITNRDAMEHDKAIWYLNEHFSSQLIREFPLRAILLPRVTGQRDTHFRVASARAALFALAPSTVSQVPNAGSVVFQHLAELTRQVPVYELQVGTELSQIPETIRTILDSHKQ